MQKSAKKQLKKYAKNVLETGQKNNLKNDSNKLLKSKIHQTWINSLKT